jgi:hypothetical protein
MSSGSLEMSSVTASSSPARTARISALPAARMNRACGACAYVVRVRVCESESECVRVGARDESESECVRVGARDESESECVRVGARDERQAREHENHA